MYIDTATPPLPCNETWRVDPSRPTIDIYSMIELDAMRNLQTISTGTLPGSIIILIIIDLVPRATWMTWMFVALGSLFAITGGTLFTAYETEKHAMTIVFYVLAQLLLNLGPNTMTWILPAELFQTKYRGTLYGVAACAGKLGAITIQIINSLKVKNHGRDALAGMLLGLCPAMLLGALFTWAWIPEVQLPRGYHEEEDLDEATSQTGDGLENQPLTQQNSEQGPGSGRDKNAVKKTFIQKLLLKNRGLEDIAEEPARDQIIGFRENIKHLLGRRSKSPSGAPSGPMVQDAEMQEL
jgi:PHS family inorganic phosphate transporter-like MFS transporter